MGSLDSMDSVHFKVLMNSVDSIVFMGSMDFILAQEVDNLLAQEEDPLPAQEEILVRAQAKRSDRASSVWEYTL